MRAVICRTFDEMPQWCADGRLKPETWKTFPLDGFREALAAIESREVIGRVAPTMRRFSWAICVC